jgi:hypothetical protein
MTNYHIRKTETLKANSVFLPPSVSMIHDAHLQHTGDIDLAMQT